MAAKLLGTREVMERTGLGRTSIWRMEKAGTFPQRRRIVGSRVGWLEAEIDEWIESRPAAPVSDAA